MAHKKMETATKNDWHETTLGEVAKVITGKTPPTDNNDLYGDVYPFITPTDIDGSTMFCFAERKLSESGKAFQQSLLLPPKTICYTCIASIGKICMTVEPSFTNQQINAVIADEAKADHKFLFYILKYLTPSLKRIAGGTTTSIINKSQFENFTFALPPLDEQRPIAAVLSSLDDKIELLRKQNETLEEIAQATFNEWFMKLTVNGTLLEGWSMGTLGDIADNLRRGVRVQDMRPDTPYIGLEHMPRKSVALTEWDTANDLQSNKSAFNKGDLLFGKLRPYFHKVGIAPIAGVCSTDVLVIAPKSKEWFGLTFCAVSSSEFVRYTSAGAQGTKMPRTDWSHMSQYPLPIPPQNIAADFSVCIGALTNKILANVGNIRLLSEVRDALLPRLMSGEIRV